MASCLSACLPACLPVIACIPFVYARLGARTPPVKSITTLDDEERKKILKVKPPGAMEAAAAFRLRSELPIHPLEACLSPDAR